MKMVVVYYSRTGSTKFVAEKIAEQLNADLCEVIDKKNRKGTFSYLTDGMASLREKLTEIELSRPVEDYEFMVIGSPVWTGKIAPAIRKFLLSNDISGKPVAFFVTLGGRRPEKSLNHMKEVVLPKRLIGEFAASSPLEKREETEAKIAEWCKQIQNTLNSNATTHLTNIREAAPFAKLGLYTNLCYGVYLRSSGKHHNCRGHLFHLQVFSFGDALQNL
ncbi:MAG: flavodoxin family protein [Candidatus Bathyarchaeota archaeon]|nr:flavodoxin family protein [Candidatus Bathyarchaeota archaeon]